MNTQELRNINTEIRLDKQSRMVEGYAVVFNSQSEDLGFRETIHPGAITEETINKSDVLCRFNHDDSKVLARSNKGKGSLLLEVDERGLKYTFEAPKTALGDELLEYLERGDIDSSSFAFTVNREDKTAEKWSHKDGILYRDIYKIDELFDVAPVFRPAYQATSVTNRFSEVKATLDEVKRITDHINSEIDELIAD